MDNLNEWNEAIEIASGSGKRGYIIFGENDHTIPQENIVQFSDLLNRADIPCELEIVPDAEHEFVRDYEESLKRALRFSNPA